MKRSLFSLYKMIKYLRDDEVGLSKKLLFLVPVIYFFIPIDILPDYFFPLGWLDDTAVVVIIITIIKNLLSKYKLSNSADEDKRDRDDEDVIDIEKDDYDFK
mgnify:CR=1 FL=1